MPLALALAVGLGFADDAGLPDITLLVVHLAAAALALLVVRIGLQRRRHPGQVRGGDHLCGAR